MPDEMLIPLANVPRFRRMSEYFGICAMEPTRFTRMVDHVQRMAAGGSLAAHVAEGLARQRAMDSEERNENRQSRRLYEVRSSGKSGGDGPTQIAIIDLSGTLMKQVGSLDDGTSTAFARLQLRTAVADRDVGAIMLRIDSPGGYVSGTEDLAADIRSAAAKKPCYAFVQDLCASAAYWAACGCSKIFANNATAEIGSIGVLMAFYEATGAAAMQGLKAVVITTGSLKGTGFPGTEITAEQRAYLQGLVNATHDEFLAVVARGRGLSLAAIEKLATGAVYPAKAAVENGLIDGIKTQDDVEQLLAEAAGMTGTAAGGGGGSGRGRGGRRGETPAPAQSIVDPGAGDGARRAAASPQIPPKEVVMTSPDTAPGASAQGPKPATLQELKQRLPKSNAAFREDCLEKNLTMEQAAIAYADASAAEIEQLKAAGKKVGNVVVAGAGKLPNVAEITGTPRRALMTRASEIMRESNGKIARHEAWKQACKENPEQRRDLVVAHNLKYGRKKQAARFNEEFEDVAPPADE